MQWPALSENVLHSNVEVGGAIRLKIWVADIDRCRRQARARLGGGTSSSESCGVWKVVPTEARTAVSPVGVQTNPARGSKLLPNVLKSLSYAATE